MNSIVIVHPFLLPSPHILLTAFANDQIPIRKTPGPNRPAREGEQTDKEKAQLLSGTALGQSINKSSPQSIKQVLFYDLTCVLMSFASVHALSLSLPTMA